jgi:predicted phosphoribosyltransferase
LRRPLVLAVPRGGVVTGAALADALGAELDVVLSRKLRAPHQPELAVGAISEAGEIHLDEYTAEELGLTAELLAVERRHQLEEIARRKTLFRRVRPVAPIEGRSVIVTDDGIATGSTMIAALQAVRLHGPLELILAIPVAPPNRLPSIERYCDQVICLLAPRAFRAVGEFYDDFRQVEDDEVVEILQAHVAHRGFPRQAAEARRTEGGGSHWRAALAASHSLHRRGVDGGVE